MKILKILFIFVLFYSCQNNNKEYQINNDYQTEIDTFFKAKMEERKGDYLQLIALHKLDSGNNTFGKGRDNNLILKVNDISETIGTIKLKGSSLSFNSEGNAGVKTKNDSLINETLLDLNEYGSSEKLYHNQIYWQIITRSKQQYLRVWDKENPAIEAFNGFKKYDLNSSLILDGNFTYFEKEKSELVKAKVDGQRSINFIGNVTFDYQGTNYSLDVGTDGFTMVGDITNGDSTYGGGRYFYLDLPIQNGLVKIDFNKLYNPPCAFSEFTTCLYPPRQNQLPFKVLAGETNTPL